MKTLALTLPVLGIFALATPASAVSPASLAPGAMSGSIVVSQQDTCKEGEQWNEDTKKCEKKEG